ncbi:hypothetical protein N656DRAFT_775262 [Canariomyces notabilis]|uniref:Uncharacterized protein n=1 Tax=Canariomyces notabilis TaxID=2074819 RepID=A0AAN6TLV9_9PEZI|nr:hypothetical protein N656DRAFT_775262 [Canariomyces arenarius]
MQLTATIQQEEKRNKPTITLLVMLDACPHLSFQFFRVLRPQGQSLLRDRSRGSWK